MANKYETWRKRITWEGYKTPLNDANLNNIEERIQEISNYLSLIQNSGMLIGKGVIIGEDSPSVSPDTYLSILDGNTAIARFDSSDIRLFNDTLDDDYTPLLHIHVDDDNTNNDFISFKGTKITAQNIELPQRWKNINDAYDTAEANGVDGASDHKLKGGLLYKDFNGNIQIFPLSPAYGVRTDECGYTEAAVAVYNTAQQLLVKPATDGRHTVPLSQLREELAKYLSLTGGTVNGNVTVNGNAIFTKTTTISHASNPCFKLHDLSTDTKYNVQAVRGEVGIGLKWDKSFRVDSNGNAKVPGTLSASEASTGSEVVTLKQLNAFFGGGSTYTVGSDASSLKNIPPVDLTPHINERKCYVFCRDSKNKFAPKYYSEPPFPEELAERDAEGRLRAEAPDVDSDNIYDDFVVNVDYLNRRLDELEARLSGK